MKEKAREILENYFQQFQLSIGNPPDPMSEKAIEYFVNAMEEYAEYRLNEIKNNKQQPTLF